MQLQRMPENASQVLRGESYSVNGTQSILASRLKMSAWAGERVPAMVQAGSDVL